MYGKILLPRVSFRISFPIFLRGVPSWLFDVGWTIAVGRCFCCLFVAHVRAVIGVFSLFGFLCVRFDVLSSSASLSFWFVTHLFVRPSVRPSVCLSFDYFLTVVKYPVILCDLVYPFCFSSKYLSLLHCVFLLFTCVSVSFAPCFVRGDVVCCCRVLFCLHVLFCFARLVLFSRYHFDAVIVSARVMVCFVCARFSLQRMVCALRSRSHGTTRMRLFIACLSTILQTLILPPLRLRHPPPPPSSITYRDHYAHHYHHRYYFCYRYTFNSTISRAMFSKTTLFARARKNETQTT